MRDSELELRGCEIARKLELREGGRWYAILGEGGVEG
jgi:hypothetical protein